MSKDDIFSTVPKHNYIEKAEEMNSEAFEKLVHSRRSVRVFTEEPIPENIMQKCLDLALLAPNSSNLQPWEFYWVRTEAKKKALVEACLSQPAAATAAELIVCVARTKTWDKNRKLMLKIFDEEENKGNMVPKSARHYYEKLVPIVYNVGPLGTLAPIRWLATRIRGLKTPTPREPLGAADLKTWAVKTTALACENLMLAFRAFGFDSCPMEGMDSNRIIDILELSKDASVVMVISAGKRADNGVYGKRVRFSRESFIKEV